MCVMSNVTRKTDAFTATRGIATREAGAQAVTNDLNSTLYNGAAEAQLPQGCQGQFY